MSKLQHPRYPMSVTMHRGGPLVACDDGTVWWYCPEMGEWTDYDDAIPGTRAALASSEGDHRATTDPHVTP